MADIARSCARNTEGLVRIALGFVSLYKKGRNGGNQGIFFGESRHLHRFPSRQAAQEKSEVYCRYVRLVKARLIQSRQNAGGVLQSKS